jgi:hypothetical protein
MKVMGFLRVKRRLSPTKTVRAMSERRNAEQARALDLLLVESRLANGKPQLRQLAHLGSIQESAIDDLEARARFWASVDRLLDALGFPVGTMVGERLRASLAVRVNPPGRADERPMRLEDARDSVFLQLVARARDGGEGLRRDAHETANQLARDQGDDVRLAHVLRYRQAFPHDLRANLLRNAWKEARHPSRFNHAEIVAAFRELGPLAYEADLPHDPTIRIYRVVGPQGVVRGMAWTTDPNKLLIFIRRVFLNQLDVAAPRPARVYTATVSPDCILATYRFESEIVVDPQWLTGVRLLRLVGPDGEDWVPSGHIA